MRGPPTILINTAEIELWPASRLRARSNRDARILARAGYVLRRKRDGRYLAAALPEGPLSERMVAIDPHWQRAAGLAEALRALSAAGRGNAPNRPPAPLPLARLRERLNTLGLDAEDYARRTGLPLTAEPSWLADAGRDRYRRPLWLHPGAARAWAALRSHAAREDVMLEAISGYRSHDYQLGIFERKFARGLTLEQILAVNAAPGYSEHHSGRALDIGTPGEPPAEESFERTPAFAWLRAHAGEFGFRLSYPRDNPHGIVYEPWHWYWVG